MYRASRMDNRYGSLLVQMILVLLTSDSRVRLILWEFWVCYFGPPLLRCMVSRRERVVVVSPMYVWLCSSQSPSWQENWYMWLVFLRLLVGGVRLFLMIRLVILLLL